MTDATTDLRELLIDIVRLSDAGRHAAAILRRIERARDSSQPGRSGGAARTDAEARRAIDDVLGACRRLLAAMAEAPATDAPQPREADPRSLLPCGVLDELRELPLPDCLALLSAADLPEDAETIAQAGAALASGDEQQARRLLRQPTRAAVTRIRDRCADHLLFDRLAHRLAARADEQLERGRRANAEIGRAAEAYRQQAAVGGSA